MPRPRSSSPTARTCSPTTTTFPATYVLIYQLTHYSLTHSTPPTRVPFLLVLFLASHGSQTNAPPGVGRVGWQFNLNGNIIFRALHPGRAILDGGGTTGFFAIDSGSLTFEGLVFTNGFGVRFLHPQTFSLHGLGAHVS